MKNVSSRHHYIPKFFIKGFVNQNNTLFVYDIEKDEINKRSISPKSIFFEWDRNTITLKGQQLSELENFYSEIDNLCAPLIGELKSMPNKAGLLTLDRVSILSYFVLHLFWRIPFTDKAFKKMNATTKHSFTNVKTKKPIEVNSETKEFLKSKDAEKFLKLIYVDDQIKKAIASDELNKETMNAQLFGFEEDYFLIGDNPIIFKGTPSNFSELMESEFILPISSKRIFCHRNSSDLTLSRKQIAVINSIIIVQSKKRIASPNKRFLEASINAYKFFLQNPNFPTEKENLFL